MKKNIFLFIALILTSNGLSQNHYKGTWSGIIYKKNINKGTIDVVKDSSSNLIVEIFDFKKNKLKLLIPFKGNKTINQKLTIGDSNKLFINRFKEYRISNMNSTIHISKNTFYNKMKKLNKFYFLKIKRSNHLISIMELNLSIFSYFIHQHLTFGFTNLNTNLGSNTKKMIKI